MQSGNCKLVKMEDFNLEWIQQKSKTYLQLLFIDDDYVFHKNFVIRTNMRGGSINSKGLLRDMIVVINAIYILLSQHGRDFIYQDAFIIIDCLSGMQGVGAQMRPPEEELEVGLPLEEEEEEEFLFIFMKENMNYLE